jgi:hypothetical protein
MRLLRRDKKGSAFTRHKRYGHSFSKKEGITLKKMQSGSRLGKIPKIRKHPLSLILEAIGV